MKKIVLGLLLPLLCLVALAQEKDLARQLVLSNVEQIKMNAVDAKSFFISDTYTNDGITMVYANQEFKGVPVMNQLYVLSFRGEKLLSAAGGFIQNMESATASKSAIPSLNAGAAATKALAQKSIAGGNLPSSNKVAANKYNLGKTSGVTEDVVATLLWVPVPLSSEVKLAWQVQVVPKGKEDYWLINIDAHTGTYISELNLTVFEQFGKHNTPALLARAKDTKPNNVNSQLLNESKATSPSAVANASYLVIPYPAEAPNFGAAATINNPWTSAPGNATTLGWHSDGTTDYTITRGNNAWATEDRAASNANSGNPATSSTSPNPLTFNFPPDYNASATSTAFQNFAVTNLFYWNNIVHDITYNYGFNEVAGNFQKNNQGRGGNQNDDVIALAQSGAGTNNANFSTPGDGGRPRMRMYLFDPSPSIVLTINTPAPIAGTYAAVESGFSTANKICNVGPKTGQLVYFDDATGGTHDACTGAPITSLAGKIALINRNVCGFTIKVLEAQNAGAIAVIMVNNVPGAPIVMGGTDNTITIPAFMVSNTDGAIFATQIGNNVTLTMSGSGCQSLDGDLDAGIIVHEYGHGISNRFTGGPSASGCLSNVEQGGEGWSDYIGLMLTTNWAAANVNSGTTGRGIGTYVIGQPTTGAGIRNYKYSTDMGVNPITYANVGSGVIGTEVHNIGEVWCAAIWEMTWGLIQQSNSIDPNLYNYSAASNAGNVVAFKLVLEGMKLQNCSPGFIDSRNGVLAADRNLYNGAHACTIWTAFAKRGMGFGSSQGSSNSATDQTSTTTIPPAPTVTTQPVDVTVAPAATATFTASAGTDPNLIYQWQVSTDNGANFTDIIGQISATLTLTNVQLASSNNLYRARVFYACDFTNTTNAKLTVVGAPTLPVITTQPANVSVCSGTNASFTVAATGAALSYVWQVSVGGGAFSNVIPAATNATLTLNAVTVGMSTNQYRVIITNASGSVTSNPATLTVSAASTVAISNQPQAAIVCSGTTASFSVTTTGVPVSYVWQVSVGGAAFADISPAVTTAALSLPNVTTAMSGNQYRVVVTGGCPVTITNSNAATLTVNNAVVTVTANPSSTTVCAPAAASFTATVTGDNLGYQWQVSTDNGVNYSNIPGANATTYNTGATTVAMNNNRYRLVATNTCNPGGITSTGAILTVGTAVSVATQPANVTTCAGTDATFTAGITGTGATYQWQLSQSGAAFANIAGATSTSLTVTGVTAAMSGNRYQLVVTGSCNNVTSGIATLTVNTLIAITQQPTSVTICNGANTSFSVTAGSGATYQWQLSQAGGAFTNISGATSASYAVTAATTTMNGNSYRVVISGSPCGTTTSNAATLTVNATPVVSIAEVTVGGVIGVQATVTPAGAYTYEWYKEGVLVTNLSGAFNASTTLQNGAYTVVATSALGCKGTSNSIDIFTGALNSLVIFPNPNTGVFKVKYITNSSIPLRGMIIYDSKGARVYQQNYNLSGNNVIMDVNMKNATGGIYSIDLLDGNGKRLATGKFSIGSH